MSLHRVIELCYVYVLLCLVGDSDLPAEGAINDFVAARVLRAQPHRSRTACPVGHTPHSVMYSCYVRYSDYCLSALPATGVKCMVQPVLSTRPTGYWCEVYGTTCTVYPPYRLLV